MTSMGSVPPYGPVPAHCRRCREYLARCAWNRTLGRNLIRDDAGFCVVAIGQTQMFLGGWHGLRNRTEQTIRNKRIIAQKLAYPIITA